MKNIEQCLNVSVVRVIKNVSDSSKLPSWKTTHCDNVWGVDIIGSFSCNLAMPIKDTLNKMNFRDLGQEMFGHPGCT